MLVATIPAPESVPGKVSHRCFFPGHVDRHPSAFTRFGERGCFTYCSACGRKMWGRYEITGGEARIYESSWSGETTSRKTEGQKSQETDIVSEILASIAAGNLSVSEQATAFWQKFLEERGIDWKMLAHLENPPQICPVGIRFPLLVLPEGAFSPDSLRTDGFWLCSLSLLVVRKKHQGVHFYTPNPSALTEGKRQVYVVSNPISALRIAIAGRNVVAVPTGLVQDGGFLWALGQIPVFLSTAGRNLENWPELFLQ